MTLTKGELPPKPLQQPQCRSPFGGAQVHNYDFVCTRTITQYNVRGVEHSPLTDVYVRSSSDQEVVCVDVETGHYNNMGPVGIFHDAPGNSIQYGRYTTYREVHQLLSEYGEFYSVDNNDDDGRMWFWFPKQQRFRHARPEEYDLV